MCGIYGYIGKPKNVELTYRIIKALAIETESRGTDSTGVAAVADEYYYCEKRVLPASKFFESVDIKKMIKEKCHYFVGHNRWASCGDVNSDNAHPFVGPKHIFVHNGTCMEAKEFAEQDNIITKGDTDSEALLMIEEKYGVGALRKFHGLSTVSIDYDTKEGKMIFYRDYNPMVICDAQKMLGLILFASTEEILKSALKKSCNSNLVKVLMKQTCKTPARKFVSFDKNGNSKTFMFKSNAKLEVALNRMNKKEDKLNEDINYWSQTFAPSRDAETNRLQDDEKRFFDYHKNRLYDRGSRAGSFCGRL